VRPHGDFGALRCQIYTEFPQRFLRTRRVFIGPELRSFHVRRARVEHGSVLLWLRELATGEEAYELRGQEVLIPREEAVPLPEGRFYWHQVLGLEARDEAGQALGSVVDIIETGANDVYVLRTPDGGELLIPALKDVVLAIEPDAGTMTVRLLPGLEPTRTKQ